MKRFFDPGSDELVRIGDAARAIEIRLTRHSEIRTPEDFAGFVASRGNAILMTEPRAVRVEKPALETERLFNQLVDEPSADVLNGVEEALGRLAKAR